MDEGEPTAPRCPLTDHSAGTLAYEAYQLAQLAAAYSHLEQGGQLPKGIPEGAFEEIAALTKEALRKLRAVWPQEAEENIRNEA